MVVVVMVSQKLVVELMGFAGVEYFRDADSSLRSE
jgi:hypothetical protein